MSNYHNTLSQLSTAQPNYRIEIPESWGQGRATFGGLIVSLLYKAMRLNVAQDRLIRTVSVSFVGPVARGALDIEVTILRAGGSVTQVEAKALQEGQVQCVVLASFGAKRDSELNIPAPLAPDAKPPEDCREMPYIPGVLPEFTQHVCYRWAFGDMPFSNSKHHEMGGWIRFKQPEEELQHQPVDEAAVLSLVDAWPPALLPLYKKPAPASSLSWYIEFIQPIEAIDAESWLLYKADIDQVSSGYGQTHAQLWSSDGELIAISRQTIAVFA
ncbi:thioesterase family protein [Litoribacillus peritrichatus]|uniref:Thioesterase family protein n=1 Tax=Litoribacillus peritrichatus TaxID=718191 RepID=A0ABP7MPJ5_9GAMM